MKTEAYGVHDGSVRHACQTGDLPDKRAPWSGRSW